MSRARILIIEDERPLAEALAASLEREGYEVALAFDGRQGLRRAGQILPDLIVLDLVLPRLPGMEVCQALRSAPRTRSIPIIITTMMSEERDQIVGLAMGADDYVTKPFRMSVLVQRIKRLIDLQRRQREPRKGTIVECHGLRIDRYRHRASYRGTELRLTPIEYGLLEALLRQPGRAFTRIELIETALGEHVSVGDRTIDVHVKAVRKKLGAAAHLIETVRGIGYRLRAAPGPES
jgi:two-component system phosphate regulon response regulator PhoB